MIKCEQFSQICQSSGLTYFTGVPDSLFKSWMSYLTDHPREFTNRIASNEGSAIAHAAGYHLATQEIGVVYLQNSGLGNCVNPLTSLADPEVYGIPMILLIGWRGEPSTKDEPQHKKMGRIMPGLLESLEVPYEVLDADNVEAQIKRFKELAQAKSMPVALIVKKDMFEDYASKVLNGQEYELSREEAIKLVVDHCSDKDQVVATTGKTSRELFEYRQAKKQPHGTDFYTVGSMGHASAIAFEIAQQKKDNRVFIFDGDGALIMHMGTLTTIGHYAPQNLTHIVFDNHAHESTGAQPTVSKGLDISKVALACGYKSSVVCRTAKELVDAIGASQAGPSMIIVEVNVGSRKDLGRPTTTPEENKNAFMGALKIS